MSDWEVVAKPESDWTVVQPDAAEEGGPASFLRADKFQPSPGQRPFKHQTGPMEQVRSDLTQRRADPLSGSVLSGMDRASLGGLGAALRLDREIADNPVARAVDAIPVLGPLIGKHGGDTARQSLEAMEGYRLAHPTLSQYTDAPAYMAGAPGRVATAATERIAPALARGGIGPLQTLLARTSIPAAASGGVTNASEAASEGASPQDVGEAALEGAAGGAMVATPLAIMARAGGAAGRAVQRSKGGKAREFIEQRGGARVGPGTAGEGGKFDEMVTHGHDDAAIGQQAEVSAKRGLDMLNEEKRGVLNAVGRRIGNVSNTPEAGQLRDVSNVVANIESSLNELDTSPQARAALRDTLEAIKSKQGQGFNPDTDNYLLTEADLNKLKRSIDRYAKTGLSTEEKLHPLREAASETRGMVNEGPYAGPNAEYSTESKRYQQSRKLLGITERPKTPNESQEATNKVKNLITRRGQQTVTAGGQEARLNEFEQRHPDIAEEFVKPELLRKRADIGFHLFPQHGGLIDRTAHPIASVAMHSLLGGATGILPMLAYSNRNAIMARLLYGPALGMQAMEPLLLNQAPLLAAPGQREAR